MQLTRLALKVVNRRMSTDGPTRNISDSDGDLLRQILARLGSMESRLESLESGQSALKSGQATLDQKVEARLKETRPIWEAVQVRMTELKATVDELKDEVKRGFRNAERQTTVLLKEMHKVKTDVEDHEDRLTELESHTS